jgi:hypothetical protein
MLIEPPRDAATADGPRTLARIARGSLQSLMPIGISRFSGAALEEDHG